jgi:hypothetical protein
MKKMIYSVIFLILAQIVSVSPAVAGVDLVGHVKKFQVAPDGNLWFSLDAGGIAGFCKPYWYDISLYIKIDNPEYNYCYGMLMTAYVKGSRSWSRTLAFMMELFHATSVKRDTGSFSSNSVI